jgi:HAMP domain-containing protein
VADPYVIVCLTLSGLAFAMGSGALYLGLRSAPTRVLGALDDVLAAGQASARVARQATEDVGTMRDEWARHRLEVGKLLDAAVDAMDEAERKRRSARMQRTKAEEVRDQVEQEAEPADRLCPGCQYPHSTAQNCVEAAKVRFRAQGMDC